MARPVLLRRSMFATSSASDEVTGSAEGVVIDDDGDEDDGGGEEEEQTTETSVLSSSQVDSSQLMLRPYQQQALDALREDLRGTGGGPQRYSGLVIMAAGTGKSLLCAALVKSQLEANPACRIAVITQSKELVEQNLTELQRYYPEIEADGRLGVYSSGLNRRDTRSQVLLATIQSLHSLKDKRDLVEPPFDLVIIDEAHSFSHDANSRYSQFLSAQRAANPELQLVGLTATPYRLDSGHLTAAPTLFPVAQQAVAKIKWDEQPSAPRLFDKVVFEYGITQAIRDGYLCPLVTRCTKAELDIPAERKQLTKKDFDPSDLESLVNTQALNELICAEIVEQGKHRKTWLIFCVSIEHAKAVASTITRLLQAEDSSSEGVCEAVYGSMPLKERERLVERYRAGEIRALTNVGVLTVGFNVPEVDLVALCRPTLSGSLYVQMVGRGARTAPGKNDCVVLDFARNIVQHGLVEHREMTAALDKIDDDAEFYKENPNMAAIVCDNCGTYNPTLRRTPGLQCYNCHSELPDLATESKNGGPRSLDYSEKLDEKPYRAPEELPKNDNVPPGSYRCKVLGVAYHRHKKAGVKIPTLRVKYSCLDPAGQNRTIPEWVCLEHPGYAKKKAGEWWRRRIKEQPPAGVVDNLPKTVDEAIKRSGELIEPATIIIGSGDFPEITPEFAHII